MSVNDSRAKLHRGQKELWACWQRALASWQDDNRRAFEKQWLTPLQSELRKVEIAMGRLDAMIQQIQHECR
ncbi:MAG: hypothetical protein JW810_10135 [Sedimentisphaerales bacterium]|nr:hypothetical protein [Sedimentisphaerales bacterium]